MHRRDLLKAGVGAVLLGSAARGDDPVAESDLAEAMRKAAPLFAKMKMETAPLTDRIHLIHGVGGNVAVLSGPDGAFVIDAGLPDRGQPIFDAAKALAKQPVSTLINTHWHFDHAGGNAAFGKNGVHIWSTPNTRKRLAADQYNEGLKMKTPASPPEALPVLTFEEAEVRVGDETLHLVSVPPAHTDGDLIIHFQKADILHTGDLYSKGIYPFIDVSTGGWLGGMVAAADRILKLAGPKTRIIPGHGPVATRADLASYRSVLATIYDRLAPMVDSGKTVEEAIRARPTKEFDATLGQGMLNGPSFTRMAYDGLLKHRESSGK